MKKIALLLGLVYIVSCGNEETSESADASLNTNEVSKDSLAPEGMDTSEVSSNETTTITAMVDGPDDDFFIENWNGFNSETIQEVSSLDIVPYVYGADDSTVIYPSFRVIARNNFYVTYFGLNDYTGTINLYYDAAKKHLATSYSVIKGKPDGNCTLYDTDGSVFIERVYKNGVWQYSGKEPYAVDWTYDQNNSSLIVNDTDNGVRSDSLVELMLSFHDEDWVYFSQIIDKVSFNQPFKINGTAYTGKLMAYQFPVYEKGIKEFELNFKDGLLHGDIKIYEWWGELSLHEIFENGEMIEQVYVMDPAMMDGVAKPIIYIYPEEEIEVTVSLNFDGKLTHTYPTYHHGWKVTAFPDGTLIDKDNKEYYALYWEGKESTPLTIPTGTVLKGSETISFLEKELPKLGLNAREANEFIIYWMPFLTNNPYNLIHFSSDAYTDMAELNITPTPETMIRVMMMFQPLDQPTAVQPQNLSLLYKERKGFTVVEWGGRMISPAIN